MEIIAAGLQNGVKYASARPPHLRIVRVSLDLHLGDRFYRRDDNGPALPIANRHSIDEKVVLPQHSTRYGRQSGAALVLHAVHNGIPHLNHVLRHFGQDEWVAANVRKFSQLLVVEDLALGRI